MSNHKNNKIMKAKYIKPCITEDLFLSDEDLMIIVSGGKGQGNIVEDGGNTNDNNITEGDARQFKVWNDEE